MLKWLSIVCVITDAGLRTDIFIKSYNPFTYNPISWSDRMSGIEEAIRRLEEIAGRHICAARREELLEIIEILRRELERENA